MEKVTEVAGDAADKVTGAASGAVSKVSDKIGGGDGDRRGLGWFWWAVGAVLLVLFLAWLLAQCSDDDTSTSTDTTEASADAAGSDDGDGTDDEDGDGDGSTGTDDDDASAGDDEADDASAGGDDDDADGSGDDDADGSDDGAEGADDGADLLAAVEAALAEAGLDGVTASVDDDIVTLTGSVPTGDDSSGAEAAVLAVAGVGSVDNQLTADDASDSGSDDESASGSDDGDGSDDGSGGSDDGDGSGDDDDSDGGSGGATAGQSLNEQLGLDTITFEYRSAVITSAGQAVLAEVVTYLESEDVDLVIEGHTDSDGAEAENIELGQRRADAVKAYLEANGIDSARLEAVGIGEGQPKVPNDSLDNKAINRRIELVVAG